VFNDRNSKFKFDEGCSELLDQRKKLKCNGYRIQVKKIGTNNGRCEASRHFRSKKREYLKDKINEKSNKQ
jgi:hypothetical protein